jgi:hypothetical protein
MEVTGRIIIAGRITCAVGIRSTVVTVARSVVIGRAIESESEPESVASTVIAAAVATAAVIAVVIATTAAIGGSRIAMPRVTSAAGEVLTA